MKSNIYKNLHIKTVYEMLHVVRCVHKNTFMHA